MTAASDSGFTLVLLVMTTITDCMIILLTDGVETLIRLMIQTASFRGGNKSKNT